MNDSETQYNLYNILINNYDSLELSDSKKIQIQVILAIIAIHNNDLNKVEEIFDKFGSRVFNTQVSIWAKTILQQFGIDIDNPNRSNSPVNIQDINSIMID